MVHFRVFGRHRCRGGVSVINSLVRAVSNDEDLVNKRKLGVDAAEVFLYPTGSLPLDVFKEGGRTTRPPTGLP